MTTNHHPPTTHIYFLLDRTGSMASMAPDVIGGFNGFLTSQAQLPGVARMTLVQFDTVEPFEVLADAVPLTQVRPLDEHTFVPRGGTPLFDATAQLIAHAAARAEHRSVLDHHREDIVFVTFTDGEENSSRRFTRAGVLRMVQAKQAAGWTFVFLGAGLDAYAEGGQVGYSSGSTQSFAPDGGGARLAYASVDKAMTAHRERVAAGAPPLQAEWFREAGKEAEEDRTRRHR